MAKVIVVFGATGGQGNSITRALLKSGFAARAVTRNPNSDAAKGLKAAGAEVVKADLDDVASVDSALKGAYGAFLVTDYWGQLAKLRNEEEAYKAEIRHGKSVTDAAIKAGVKHFIYSSLPSVKESTGKFCAHFETKEEIVKYVKASGVPYSFVEYPFYYQNFLKFAACKPQKQDDGTYSIVMCMEGPMFTMDVDDGGPVVAAMFSRPEETLGKTYRMCGDDIPVSQYAAIMSKVTGKTINYKQLSVEEYAKLPFPGAEELSVMWGFFPTRLQKCDPELTKRLNPKTQSFEEWAVKNKDEILKALG